MAVPQSVLITATGDAAGTRSRVGSEPLPASSCAASATIISFLLPAILDAPRQHPDVQRCQVGFDPRQLCRHALRQVVAVLVLLGQDVMAFGKLAAPLLVRRGEAGSCVSNASPERAETVLCRLGAKPASAGPKGETRKSTN